MASPLRLLADRAFSRAAGAPLVEGNEVRLLCDAEENFPAWLDAINNAHRWVHFESYIIHDDQTGREFAAAMMAAAKRGVRVRIIYDWLGALTATTWMFWERLRRAGAEVRPFNQPRLDSPLGWLSRDHRKMLGVDGTVGFVTGLCVGNMWWGGERNKGADPWRDTGVAIRGPAVVEVEQAFADVWEATGPPLPGDEVLLDGSIPPAGSVAMRVIGTRPSTGAVFRLDQLVSAIARERVWITDAYFVGASPYVQALTAAATDGVDVRLLVPGSGTDLPAIQRLTRAGYRGLLEAGVRIFEWNGTMVHAKTAVADGRWARVGSTNLNLQSWLGNWELDVAIEDEDFARQMEDVYQSDLENATEIVLTESRVTSTRPDADRSRVSKANQWRQGKGTGRTRRAAAAGAMRMGRTFGAALTARRALGTGETGTLVWGVAVLAALGAISLKWPRAIAYPLGILLLWLAVSWLLQAAKAWWKRDHAARTHERSVPRRIDAA